MILSVRNFGWLRKKVTLTGTAAPLVSDLHQNLWKLFKSVWQKPRERGLLPVKTPRLDLQEPVIAHHTVLGNDRLTPDFMGRAYSGRPYTVTQTCKWKSKKMCLRLSPAISCFVSIDSLPQSH